MGQNFARNWLVPLSGCKSGTYGHIATSNIDKDPHEVKCHIRALCDPPPHTHTSVVWHNESICYFIELRISRRHFKEVDVMMDGLNSSKQNGPFFGTPYICILYQWPTDTSIMPMLFRYGNYKSFIPIETTGLKFWD